MTIKLKTITDTSWLVLGDTDETRIGLLSEVRSQYVLMVKGVKQLFLDRKAVNTYFNQNIFNNIVEIEEPLDAKKDYFINGFPVDFDKPHEVILTGTSLPLYSKKATSEIYYSAGHYCLAFPKDWMQAFCPKLSTLQTYKYAGPFKTDIEMRSNLQRLRKERVMSKNERN